MICGSKAILYRFFLYAFRKQFLVIGLLFISSVLTPMHSQDFYNPESPPLGKTRYNTIREALKTGNYSLAENLIQEEWNTHQGDPELEYFRVDLWLRKANQLYEKEQYKSALDYYTKVYKFWPNHPTVNERIFRWKDKQVYNKNSQTKNLGDRDFSKKTPESSRLTDEYTKNFSPELLVIKEKLDQNKDRLDSFLSAVYVLIGLLVAICIFLFAILWKLVFSFGYNSLSPPTQKINSGERK